GVKLVLSTGQPRRQTAARLPAPWRIGVEPPPRARAEVAYDGLAKPSAVAQAPAPLMAGREPLFDVSVFNGSFATEFSVPHAIDVPSGGERVAMTLGQHDDTVKLAVRT